MTLIDPNASRTSWTTQDECTFVRHLYEWRGPERLQNYLDSCRLRRRWGAIDKRVALATARRLLANGPG